jgi:hypothetical protein
MFEIQKISIIFNHQYRYLIKSRTGMSLGIGTGVGRNPGFQVTKDSNIGRLQEEKGSLYRFLSL